MKEGKSVNSNLTGYLKRSVLAALAAVLAFTLSSCAEMNPFYSPEPTVSESEKVIELPPISLQPEPAVSEAPSPTATTPSLPKPPTIGIATPNPIPTNAQPLPSGQVLNWSAMTMDEKLQAFDVLCDDSRQLQTLLREVQWDDGKSTGRFQSKMRPPLPKDLVNQRFILDDGFVDYIATNSDGTDNFVILDAYKFQWSEDTYEGNFSIQCCFSTPDYESLLHLFCETAASCGYEIEEAAVKAIADELYPTKDSGDDFWQSKFSSQDSHVILQVRVLNVGAEQNSISFLISETI